MQITNNPGLRSAVSAASAPSSDAVNILVLKKALDMQAASAVQLIEALPQPALATSGSVGRLVNTFA